MRIHPREALLVFLALTSAACKASSGAGGDFQLSLLPANLSLLPGQTGVVAVTLKRTAAFAGSVAVTATGLPAGVAADPLTISTNSGYLLLHATSGAGPTTVAVTASASGISHRGSVVVQVASSLPAGGANPTATAAVNVGQLGFANPTGVAVNRSNGKVYAVSDQGNGLAIYDPAANTQAVIALPSAADRVAVNSVTGVAYATSTGVGSLYAVDPAAGKVTTVQVGTSLAGVAVDEGANQIFVGDNGAAYHPVFQIDGATLQVVNNWTFGSQINGPVQGPVSVDSGRRLVYASLYGGVGAISLSTGEMATFALSRINSTLTAAPADLTLDPASGTSYVLGHDGSSGNDGWIHLLDNSYIPNSTSATATNAARAMAVDPGTNKLYVTDSANGSVNVVDLNTSAFLKQVPIATPGISNQGPLGVAVNPSNHQVYATMRLYNGVPAIIVINGA